MDYCKGQENLFSCLLPERLKTCLLCGIWRETFLAKLCYVGVS